MNESKYRQNGEHQMMQRGAKNEYNHRRRQNASLSRNADSFERNSRTNQSHQQWNQNLLDSGTFGDESNPSASVQDSVAYQSYNQVWSKSSSFASGNSIKSKEPMQRGEKTNGDRRQQAMAKFTVKKREDTGGRRIGKEEASPLGSQQSQFSAPDALKYLVAPAEAEWPTLGGGQPIFQSLATPAASAQLLRPATRPAPVMPAAAAPAPAAATATPPAARPLQLRAPALPTAPLRLVAPGGQFLSEEAQEYLEPGNVNFTVIGVLGLQASGKSTLLNALLGDGSPPAGESQPREFPVEGLTHLLSNSQCTKGVQLQLTANRCLLLDSQALLALPSAESLIQAAASERRGAGGSAASAAAAATAAQTGGDFITVETGATMHGLQLTAFLMSVCHQVLVVQDGWPEPELLRLLLTADMLRPAVLEDTGFQPRLLFVLNRTDAAAAVGPDGRRAPQQALSNLLAGTFKSAAFRTDPGDVFCLPDIQEGGDLNAGLEFTEELERLRKVILTTPRHHMLQQDLFNEKVWLEFASQVWDGIQKSVMLAEYHRLIS